MNDKVMLITGAACGIGAVTARLAAQRGYAVCINYARSSKDADALVAEIRGACGQAIAVQADIARDDDRARSTRSRSASLAPGRKTRAPRVST